MQLTILLFDAASFGEAFTDGLMMGLIVLSILIPALLIGFYIQKSIFLPESGKYYIVEFFNQFHSVVGHTEGYSLNDPRKHHNMNIRDWEIIEDDKGEFDARNFFQKKYNWYFVFFPFFKIKEYEVRYNKSIDSSNKAEGDAILWKSPDESQMIVGRTRMTNYVPFRAAHAHLTPHVNTGSGLSKEQIEHLKEQKVPVPEIIGINPRTNSIVQATNPYHMVYRIDNYVGAFFGKFDARLRGFMGKTSILKLNEIDSEDPTKESDAKAISPYMKEINTASEADDDDGVEEMYGVRLHAVNFTGFEGTTEKDKQIINTINDIFIAQQEASAAGIRGKGQGEEIKNRLTEQAIGEQELLRRTGKIKVDDKGNTTELVPDANVKSFTQALEKTKVKTLVFGPGVVPTLDVQNNN